MLKILVDLQYLLNDFFFAENHLDVCDFVLFLNCLQQTPCKSDHYYENIKEIHILTVGGTLEFPILSHALLRRDVGYYLCEYVLTEA